MTAFYLRPAFPWYLVLLLIAMNTGLLAMLWLRPGGRPGQHGKIPVAEVLQFDAGQRQALEALQAPHFALTDSLRGVARVQRDSLFKRLRGGAPDPAVAERHLQALTSATGRIEAEIFDHFRQVRLLCKPEQLPLFDKDLLDRVGPPRQMPPPGGGPPHRP
jgi:periplasmic protein CpxP/Spy